METPKMLIGSDDFKKLVLHSDLFVDKSLIIRDVIEDSADVMLITRPRRWGKSMNMDMLKCFFNIEVDEHGNRLETEACVNRKLFMGGEVDLGLQSKTKKALSPLKISRHTQTIEDFQGQFPVIHISFKEVKGKSYEEIMNGVKEQIIKLFAQNKYLEIYINDGCSDLTEARKATISKYFNGNLEIDDLKNALKNLSQLFSIHFNQKSYILIDEYDTPINTAYINFGDTKEFELVTNLFSGMFGAALKGNEFLEKGIITGILRIAKANLFSDLNNVSEYCLLDEKFSKFYGFTQEEVDELISHMPYPQLSENIKKWYNGYTFGNQVVYNPWSVMQCLSNKGKLDYYWIDSGGTGLVDKALLADTLQDELQSLLEGKGIIKELEKQISLLDVESNENALYSLLVFAGYLNPKLSNDDPEDPLYLLTIPNNEVKNLYIKRVIKWVTSKLNIGSSDYNNFINLLLNKKIDQFQQQLSEYLLNSTSYHDLKKEKDYHNLLGGLIMPLTKKYIIASNKESGLGRFDHMLIPRLGKSSVNTDTAIIIEYKLCKTTDELAQAASNGLNQIFANRYASAVKEYPYVKEVLHISMAFCGKDVAIEYHIDEV